MTVTTIQQVVEVTEVGMLTATDIVEDPDTHLFVREIRAYGEPVGLGTRPLLFTLKLTASSEAFVQLSAPIQTF